MLQAYSQTYSAILGVILFPLTRCCQYQYRIAVNLSSNRMAFTARKVIISLTNPLNEHPLKTHFIQRRNSVGKVLHYFLIIAQNVNCMYSLEPAHWDGCNKICFEHVIKYIFLSENWHSWTHERCYYIV